MSLISNLKSDLTSEAIWRLLWPLRPPKSPQIGSKTYEQYAQWYVGNWGHWFQIWGQIWPLRLFGNFPAISLNTCHRSISSLPCFSFMWQRFFLMSGTRELHGIGNRTMYKYRVFDSGGGNFVEIHWKLIWLTDLLKTKATVKRKTSRYWKLTRYIVREWYAISNTLAKAQ